ncbi:MAG TPA: rhomboid family intramembrane serine protease [Myxococcales bacterium]|nr:rhomboid family intramembrane serine protease [Myxococcales bacterium]
MLLRLLGDFRRAMDLSLVLDEEGIPHELRGEGEQRWALLVEEADAARAEAALSAFERENPLPAVRERGAPPSLAVPVACGLAFFLSLLALQIWTGPASATSPWFERGSADAARILAGEWWRTITALTLHADAGHAVGNAVLGGLLLALLARSLGPGLASLLLLLSGVGGTLLAAELVRRDFVSIGASTAVFGALGALAALPQLRRRAWIPLGAGLALLAFLGTSKRADLAGHLCGFASGAILGAAVSLLPPLRNRAAQLALALLSTAVPVAAWLAAFCSR